MTESFKSAKSLVTKSPTQRFMRLAGMSARIVGQVSKSKVKTWLGKDEGEAGSSTLYRDIGEQMVETLGEMKGAAMKLGQILSQFKDVLPKELTDALATLQNASKPLPFTVLADFVEQELGRPLSHCFQRIEPDAYAAASIGQVHRAVTHSGIPVVIKIQYPGVEDCIASDLRQLKMLLRLAGILPMAHADLEIIFSEIRRALLDELDYEREADHAEDMARFHANDPGIIIPKVYRELSSRRILTMHYEPGDHPRHLRENDYPQETINALGIKLFNAIARQIFHYGHVHCDPHPGNFAFRKDGSLVIYDFGCVKQIKPEISDLLRLITRAAMHMKPELMDALLSQLGVREPGEYVPVSVYRDWSQTLMKAFSAKPVQFAEIRLHEEVITLARKHIGLWKAFHPSEHTLLVQRTIAGHYWTMKNMGVCAAFRSDLEDILGID